MLNYFIHIFLLLYVAMNIMIKVSCKKKKKFSKELASLSNNRKQSIFLYFNKSADDVPTQERGSAESRQGWTNLSRKMLQDLQ